MHRILILLALLMNSSLLHAADTQHQHDYMGSHGMALLQLPSGKWLAYHMALYQYPHNVQLLYEVSLSASAQQTLKGKTGLSLLPETFSLRKLIQGDSLNLESTIYAGHFERGGTPILKEKVGFKTQVYFRDLRNLNSAVSTAVFDRVHISDSEQLAIHQITKAPSFDTIHLLQQADARGNLECQLGNAEASAPQATISAIQQCLNSQNLYFEWQDFAR